MGLFVNPLRREPRLPLYKKIRATRTKERYSDDEDNWTDDDSEHYSSGRSSHGSRSTSGSGSTGLLMPKKNKKQKKQSGRSMRHMANMYPYRLPTKVTRYLVCSFVGILVLMILWLVRASQVENWKVNNGKVEARPPPPPIWERFTFLERYYGGVRTTVSFKDNHPEYPVVVDEPNLLLEEEEEKEEAAATAGAGAQESQQPEKQSQEDKAQEEKDSSKGDEPAKAAETIKKDDGTDSEAASKPTKRDMPVSNPWNGYAGHNEEANFTECFLDEAGTRIPQLRYFDGRPKGFPDHVIGSYEVLSLPEDICFDRWGRYGPYGFGYAQRKGGLGIGEHSEQEGAEAVWKDTPRVDYSNVDWAAAQHRCYKANAQRFKDMAPSKPTPHGFYANQRPAPSPSFDEREDEKDSKAKAEDSRKAKEEAAKSGKQSRTAVVVRLWDEYFFREEDIAHIRSLVAELSLASGGRYDVHLLVQVRRDGDHPIWADEEVYQQRIEDVIPREFRGMVTLWTETQMLSLYQGIHDLFSRGPELPVHGAYRGLSMAMQYFAHQHPEYDYFWQWEMDVRYTGHYYDLFTKLESWAKAQPRKGLWERNARFYIPSVHGSWDDFSQMARVQSEMGVVDADDVWKAMPGLDGDKAKQKQKKQKEAAGRVVWGPMRADDDNDWFEPANDDVAPVTYERDRYQWGVGEEADYISLNPMFDPDGTTWGLRDDITGFNRSEGLPPRRAHIITTARMSRRLLLTMHRMTALKKQFAFPEMWPATVALQHGYKAVFAPHPVYVDRAWPVGFMAQMFNGGRDGASGGARTSIFGDREHNMHGLSWFYNSGFAPNLFRRWLGLRVNNDGGDEFETTEDRSRKGKGVGGMRGGEGRMCLPPMLLHPVKDVEMAVEAPEEEQEKEKKEKPKPKEEDMEAILDPGA